MARGIRSSTATGGEPSGELENGTGSAAGEPNPTDSASDGQRVLADGTIVFDPVAAAGPGNDAGNSDTGPKRRGRKPGSGNRAPKSKVTLDLNAIEAMLLSTHMMLAAVTKTKELQLDPQEAKQIANATANVARHYDLGASQKAIDWAALMNVCALAYGTRFFAIRARMAQEKRDAARPSNGMAGPPPGLVITPGSVPLHVRQ